MQGIITPDHDRITELCQRVAEKASETDTQQAWPGEQLRLCAEAGVFRWFVQHIYGGSEWSYADSLQGLMRLAEACLSSTFVILQQATACKWLDVTENDWLRNEYLPGILSGDLYVNIGLSQLTTSRRHLKQPALLAEPAEGGWQLNGYCPWVTGGAYADAILIGAQTADSKQLMLTVPTNSPGLHVCEPMDLVALNATSTGKVDLENVFVPESHVLFEPMENVMSRKRGGTGGFETSALALGVALAGVQHLSEHAEKREDLQSPAEAMQAEWQQTAEDLLALAEGEQPCTREEIRGRANGLALRAAQAALTAAKGAGFVQGHLAGRLCREALFFLVWSCPQPVAQATLCELAGIDGD